VKKIHLFYRSLFSHFDLVSR